MSIDAEPPVASRHRSRRLTILVPLAVVTTIALVVSLAFLLTGSGSEAGTPGAVADAYYAALGKPDAATAYGLLCRQRQGGESSFANDVADDERTGTGIRSWSRSGAVQQRGDQSAVAGTIALDDGRSTPIVVVLVREDDAWKVCTSDLGGVIPGPGSASPPSTGPEI